MGTRRVKSRPPRRLPRPGPRTRALALGAAALLGLCLGVLAGPAARARIEGPAFTLGHVAVRGHARLDAAEVAEAGGLAAGTPLSPGALEVARTRLLAHPWIAKARVAALPPSRVLVAVEERRPVARVALEDGLAFVDPDGVAFARADAADAGPLLTGVEGAERGRPHPVLAQGVALLAALEARGLPPATRVVLGGAPPEALPALELPAPAPLGRTRVTLGPGRVEAKLDRLARLRAAGLPGAEAPATREIDLRFGDDVVLRSGPAPGASGAAGTRGGAASP